MNREQETIYIMVKDLMTKVPKATKEDLMRVSYNNGKDLCPEWAIDLVEKEKKGEIISFEDLPDENKREWYVKNYLQDPDLFKQITEDEMDKQIVGEIDTRKVIFLCACGRLVENNQTASYNLLVNSSAGAGKDYVVSKVLSMIPKERYVKKTRISPTAFTYWHNSKYEPLWSWDGKVFYTEDISENILNHEVFKVMTSSGSSATIVIKQRAIEIDIKGKPVVITTTATAVPSPELTRRFEFLNINEGIEQTKEIMKRHSEYAREGIIPEYDQELIEAQKYLKRVKVKIPYANLFHEHFPIDNIIMRTKFPRFIDYIKASASFHQYQREKDKEGYVLANGKDYDLARECIIKLCSNRYMIPLTLNQQKIMKFFEYAPNYSGSAQELLNQMKNFMALKNFINNLGILVHYGLLDKRTELNLGGKEWEIYSFPEFLKENSDVLKLPTFQELKEKGGVF